VQFTYFYADYFTGYRVRSSFWFEGNRRGAFDVVLSMDRERPLDRVHLDSAVPWLREHWRLYLVEQRRTDLLARTGGFDTNRLALGAVLGDGVLVGVSDRLLPEAKASLQRGRWIDVPEPSGGAWFFVATPPR
jgi:hypothetical protein